MSKYTTAEGLFYVEIQAPTREEIRKYYENTGEIEVSANSDNSPRIFKKATVVHTCDEEKYPVGSLWMMGESPGLTINFFGEKLVMIQEKDMYARIN